MLVLPIFMLIYCIQPCIKCGYRTTRWELLHSLGHIAIAPFGRVRFRDFFFGDVITSIVKPLEDLSYVIYYVVSDDYKNKFFPNPNNSQIYYCVFFVQLAPFWWRFCQCLNRKYYTGLDAHLVNAGKYFSKLIPPMVLIYTTFSAKKVDDINWGLYCFV